MTPGARVAAAIEVLDAIFDGVPAEKAITGWGRAHRFAGSKDRAAIRDHVFQALRCRASYGWLGGAGTGRGVMLGAARATSQVEALFNGEGHAPKPPAETEAGRPLAEADRATQLDMPDWLLPHFDAAFADQADAVLQTLQHRAGLFLRVNSGKTDVDAAIAALAKDEIIAVPVSGMKTALQVVENERRVAQSHAYTSGMVEVQDASSQQAIAALPLTAGQTALDYCAGGGGKALALAARGARVTAHDIDPRRTMDIAPRAARAGVEIDVVTPSQLSNLPPFDLVFCDAPCSGSGTWRRTPEAKWALTPDRMDDLTAMQDDVLARAAALVKPGGCLAYATCSVFEVENRSRVDHFLSQHPEFSRHVSTTIAPHELGDGFHYTYAVKSD